MKKVKIIILILFGFICLSNVQAENINHDGKEKKSVKIEMDSIKVLLNTFTRNLNVEDMEHTFELLAFDMVVDLYDYSKKTQKSLASVMNLTFLTLIF